MGAREIPSEVEVESEKQEAEQEAIQEAIQKPIKNTNLQVIQQPQAWELRHKTMLC